MEKELSYIDHLCQDCIFTCVYKDYAYHFSSLTTKNEIIDYLNKFNYEIENYSLTYKDTDDLNALKKSIVYQLVEFALKEKEVQNQY
ncbi:MAG: hypothetical protein RL113_1111 [Pseudomonadota bacterium]|jgi:hypothetical protein